MLFEVYMPDYYPKFQCLGGACRNTCCRGWEVTLTKADYQRLRNLRGEKSLQETLHSMIKRHKDVERYGYIQHDASGRCPCLDEHGLCFLQAKAGHQILPDVCRIFPRLHICYQDTSLYKRGCTPGCEVVVQQLLEQTEGLGFLHEQTKVRDLHGDWVKDKLSGKATLMEYRWPIQCALIDLLQNRAYLIEERMLLLGIALRDLDALLERGFEGEIQSWLRKITLMGQGDDCRGLLGGLAVDGRLNAASHLGLLRTEGGRLLAGLWEPVFARYQVEEPEDGSFSFQGDLVLQARDEFLAHCPQGQTLLENLMVNYLFLSSMPFEGKGAWKGFRFLAATFSLLRFVMYSSYHVGDDPAVLVDPVTALCRGLMHSEAMRNYLVDVQSSHQSDTLAHMAVLVLG